MLMQPKPLRLDPLLDVSRFSWQFYAYEGTILTIMAVFTVTLSIDAGEGCKSEITLAEHV